MSRGPTDLVLKKRRREGKTDYKKRIALVASGRPRLVVRRSLKNINLQLIEYQEEGDKVIGSANSRELIKFGWKHSRGNIPAAYLTGFLLGHKAKNVKEAILDIGLYKSVKGNVIYAALKGAVDAGLSVPHDPKILTVAGRISGEHTKNPAVVKKDLEDVKKKIEAKK